MPDNKGYMPKAESEEWETPQSLYDSLDAEFCFLLDAAASESNHKAPYYFTRQDSAFHVGNEWHQFHTVYCNPPYGKQIERWVAKAAEESRKGAVVVMLLPARTDTRWFHEHCYNRQDVEIRFIKGRIKYRLGDKSAPAPFPSMLVIFGARSLSGQSPTIQLARHLMAAKIHPKL